MNTEKDIFKAGSTTYYFSARLFPKKVRKDVFKLYSFVRTADDFVDSKPPQSKRLTALEAAYDDAMRDPNFESITHGWDELDTRVMKNIVQLSRKHKFEPEWVKAFLRSMKQDTAPKPHPILESSLDYVYGSAEVIGLMMVRILGVDKPRNIRRVLHMRAVRAHNTSKKLPKRLIDNTTERVRYRITKETAITKEAVEKEKQYIRRAACAQGRAMQWINFVRDIAEDNGLKRQYIPVADLNKFGLKDLTEATARENPEAFRKLISLQLKRYHEWQAEAEKGYSYIPKYLRVPLQTAAEGYSWTAKQIEKNPLVVFEQKVKPRKRRLALGLAKRTIR